MVTLDTATASMTRARELLDYVRGCSADIGRIASYFGATLNDDHNEITIPPIHEIFTWPADADEFIEKLRQQGFRVIASMDATHIGWRSTINFPTARQSADLTADAFNPLLEKCLRATKALIEGAVGQYKFEVVSRELLGYPKGVQTEAIIFLKNSGYKVTKCYDPRGAGDDSYDVLVGYTISWNPKKTVRDIEDIPWWKCLFKGKS